MSGEIQRTELKVLTIGPLPPPIGGMAAVVQNLEAELSNTCDHRLLNNAKTTSDDRSLFTGIAAQLALLGRLLLIGLGWRPHIVHIHTCSNFTFWRNGVDVLLCRMMGLRVVLHVHGARFHKFLAAMGPFKAWMARRILRGSKRVIALGDDWKKVLDPWCEPHRVVVVANAVPVPDESDLPERADHPLRVVCMANYEKRKGQEDLIAASAQVAGVELVLLGAEAEAGQKEKLERLAESLGVAERVEIPGPAMGKAKIKQYQLANAFCLPSYDEGLPMAMLEAMAWSLPAIVTRVGAIPEVVQDDVDALLVDAGDRDAMAAALVKLSEDLEFRKRVGAKGRELVMQSYGMSVAVRRLLSIYQDAYS